MLEDPKTPTFIGMSAEEWHAFVYGLKDGIKFWQRTHIKYEDIDKLQEPQYIKDAIKNKFHYYEIGSDLPEDLVLLAGVIYTALKSAGIV